MTRRKSKFGWRQFSWLRLPGFVSRRLAGLRGGAAGRASRWRRWLYAVGIYVPGANVRRTRLLPRFFAVAAVTGLVGLLIGAAGVVRYSETPSFCASCHIMRPYVDSWKSSSHKDVACIECHYPPDKKGALWKKYQGLSQVAKYVTRTYSSKPFAEVDDASCLRSGCHSTRLLEGPLTTPHGIKFNHRDHLVGPRRDRQLRCASCHSQMVVGRHIEVTYETCYLCHFREGGTEAAPGAEGGCLKCHQVPSKEVRVGSQTFNHKELVSRKGVSCRDCHIDVVGGTGKATQDRCFTCHNEAEKLSKFKDSSLIHGNHVTKHNVACFHCHREMRHGFLDGEGSRLTDLGGAHPSTGTVKSRFPSLRADCRHCHSSKHSGQLLMYSGTVESLGLRNVPNPMHLTHVDCAGCHYEERGTGGRAEFMGTDRQASKEACVKCHGPGFKGIWEDTLREMGDAVAKMGDKLRRASAAVGEAEGPKKKREDAVGRAKRWLAFLEEGRGEHNVFLASDILRRIDRTLAEAVEGTDAELPDLTELPLVSGSYCASMCHKRLKVKSPPEKRRFRGKMFPHSRHVEFNACVKCHDMRGHKQAPLRKNLKAVCAECHQE